MFFIIVHKANISCMISYISQFKQNAPRLLLLTKYDESVIDSKIVNWPIAN